MQPMPFNPGSIPGIAFPGIALPSSDFQAVRDGRRAPLFYFDVDLSTARTYAAGTQANIPLAANFLYIDQRLNSGVASIHFQDQNGGATPLTVFPGALWKVPFTQIGIENAAQPGKSIRIIYGVDVDALPISAAGVTVLNAININDEINPACQLVVSGLAPAIGTTVTNMLAIASNVSGARVRGFVLNDVAGAGGTITTLLVAASVAPVGYNSQASAILLGANSNSTVNAVIAQVDTLSRVIPPAWGIWSVDIVAGAAASRSVGLNVELL